MVFSQLQAWVRIRQTNKVYDCYLMGFCGCFCYATLSIHLALVILNKPTPQPLHHYLFLHWLLPDPSQPLPVPHPILPFSFCFWPGSPPRVRFCGRLALPSIFFSGIFFFLKLVFSSLPNFFPLDLTWFQYHHLKSAVTTNACITCQPILPLTCKLYNLNNSSISYTKK